MGLTVYKREDGKFKKLLFLLIGAAFYYSYEYLSLFIIDRMVDLMVYIGISDKRIDLLFGFSDSISALLISIIYFTIWRLLFREEFKNIRIAKNRNKYGYGYIDRRIQLNLFKKIIIGIVVGFGICGISGIWLVCVENYLSDINFVAVELKRFSAAFDDITAGSYIWTFMSIVLIGPISEELLFRGLIFSSLEKVIKKPIFPILVSGILFGIWHGNFIQGVYTAIMGIILAIVYYKTRDIKLTSLIHIVNNLNGTLPPIIDTDVINMAMNLISYIMIIPMMWILIFRIRRYSIT